MSDASLNVSPLQYTGPLPQIFLPMLWTLLLLLLSKMYSKIYFIPFLSCTGTLKRNSGLQSFRKETIIQCLNSFALPTLVQSKSAHACACKEHDLPLVFQLDTIFFYAYISINFYTRMGTYEYLEL